jgi:hypothetical protein
MTVAALADDCPALCRTEDTGEWREIPPAAGFLCVGTEACQNVLKCRYVGARPFTQLAPAKEPIGRRDHASSQPAVNILDGNAQQRRVALQLVGHCACQQVAECRRALRCVFCAFLRIVQNYPWLLAACQSPQHFLYFLPLPQGQGSLRPTFADCATTCAGGGAGAVSAASSPRRNAEGRLARRRVFGVRSARRFNC